MCGRGSYSPVAVPPCVVLSGGILKEARCLVRNAVAAAAAVMLVELELNVGRTACVPGDIQVEGRQ